MHQYTFSEVKSLLNEKRDIEEKNAALKAEIAEVETACIKVDSNEEIINNRVEGIKFDIAKGKETYSDLEDRLTELEDKRKRAEEQQQIFQLFEEFDDSFTVPTVESVGDTADIISKDNTDSLEDDSSSDEEALHYTPFETPILEDEVVEINGDKDDCTIYYRTNPEDEVILASQVDNAAMDNLMDSVEEDENIEEVISNAESKVVIVPHIEEKYTEEELEVMATTQQLAPEEVEFYKQGSNSSALVLVAQESPKKVEPISIDDTTLLKESDYSPNNVIAFKDNLYDKSQELEWYKGTLKEAMDASDSCFDKDCLNYIRYFVKGVKSTKVYTFNAHKNLIQGLQAIGVSNIVRFIEHGLLQYFQVGYVEQPFSEEEHNHISCYLIEKRYLKS